MIATKNVQKKKIRVIIKKLIFQAEENPPAPDQGQEAIEYDFDVEEAQEMTEEFCFESSWTQKFWTQLRKFVAWLERYPNFGADASAIYGPYSNGKEGTMELEKGLKAYALDNKEVSLLTSVRIRSGLEAAMGKYIAGIPSHQILKKAFASSLGFLILA